jgi:cell division septal protein FtsQ
MNKGAVFKRPVPNRLSQSKYLALLYDNESQNAQSEIQDSVYDLRDSHMAEVPEQN